MSYITHYRATFDVVPTQEAENQWGMLIGAVRKWIQQRMPAGEMVPKTPFFTGTAWESGNKAIHIRTARCEGERKDGTPEFWAVRWDHPCQGHPNARRWRTDIAVSGTSDRQFQFHIETAHSIRPGFIGEPPSTPTPTTPALVHWLLSGGQWAGVAGDWKLSSEPLGLKPGNLNTLRTFLQSESRQYPVVFVSRTLASGSTLVDPPHLAKLLAGNALVVVASDDADSNNEMEYVFPTAFRCWDGMVRVYLPKVLFGSETDARRHRFYRVEDIGRLGRPKVEEQLVAGLVRQPLILRKPAISSIDDVSDRLRHERIATLTAQKTDGKWSEWLKELEAATDRNKALIEKVEGLELSLAAMEEAITEKDRDIARLRFEWEQNRTKMEDAVATANSLRRVFEALQALPGDLIGVVNAIGKIHCDRVVFTERARRSAEDYDGVDTKTAWECLWSIATVLHDLHFGDSRGRDLTDEFKRLTGFKLALSEGSQTRKDAKYTKLRQDSYKGRTIDIEAHVGYGNKTGKMLRVHYAVSTDERRLVIGHCGDHLETYATQFRH